MPIYEYYCRDNNRIYQFFAKTLAQGRTIPKCPDNPKLRMEKVLSAFAVVGGTKKAEVGTAGASEGEGGREAGSAEDAKMDAAMSAMEREFSSVDENDPRAMGRMMRRMAELTGEKIDGEMEEVVRKLEEGADPDALEDQMGGGEADGPMDDPYGEGMGSPPEAPVAGADEPASGAVASAAARLRARRKPTRDPKLYDYE